ncbi:hypothetical protein G7Y89_g5720 [Cudoniella acicularis]|uniref:Rhodopsin domain-containing protein n=1 Tax=Cudoniella acicularis TaxID=354080 RepID=A0A8H4RNC1_9HELO|nr:hypothetical protein G7Y89_g5720 [Cudoniella acicularis]
MSNKDSPAVHLEDNSRFAHKIPSEAKRLGFLPTVDFYKLRKACEGQDSTTQRRLNNPFLVNQQAMAASLIGPLPPLTPEHLNDYIGKRAYDCAILFIVFDVFIVGFRYFARYITHTSFGWDDFFVLPAVLFSVSLCGIIVAMVNHAGLGHHLEALPLPTILLYAKLSVAFQFSYLFAVTLPKLAIICLYLRIFVERKYRLICYGLFGLVVLSATISLLVTSFMCIPLDALWNPLITNPRCINIASWWRWSTLPSSLFDLILIILPIPMVLKIKLPPRDKAGVFLAFSAGGIGLIASIIRIVTFMKSEGLGDLTWDGVTLAIVGMLETGTYLFAICLPQIRPFYMFVRKQGKFSTSQVTAGSSFPMTTPSQRLRSDPYVSSSQVSEPSKGSEFNFVK